MANTSIEKTEAIQRFLGYAAEYLAEFSNAIDKTQALRFMEHFLIFLTAAVQNFKPKNMKAPSIDMFLADDKWHQVCWLWEARNTVAHDYMKFHTPDAVLEFGGYESAVFVSGFFFLDVSRYDSKKKEYEVIIKANSPQGAAHAPSRHRHTRTDSFDHPLHAH